MISVSTLVKRCRGAHDLRKLIVVLEAHLRNTGILLSNQFLEAQSAVHSHIDGVDVTLIELMAEEIGDAEFIETGYQPV